MNAAIKRRTPGPSPRPPFVCIPTYLSDRGEFHSLRGK